IEFKVLRAAANGNTVFNERIDIFDLGNGKKIELPVAGVFEVRGGKIALWRDYFDLAMYTKQMG
ncbi:MAG: limonene-1,2-epoxide hydrolase family protein, partial [Candidatus Binataceae bacterium]